MRAPLSLATVPLVVGLLVAGLLGAGPARAEMSTYGAFIHDATLPNALILQGDITDGMTYDFRKALREHKVDTLLLDSPGGSVYAGLELSAIIRDKGLATVIPPDAICASACSFLFVAGVRRQAVGQLGVHQFASADDMPPTSAGETQQVTAEIVDFLKEYDVPLIFMVRMLETPSADMYWFPQDELVKDGLVTEDHFDAEIAAWNALPRDDSADPATADAAVGADAPATPDSAAAGTVQNPFAPKTTKGASNPFGGHPEGDGPSYDCARARTDTEKTICADGDLASLDQTLDQTYRSAADRLTRIAFGVIKVEQAAWLTRRDACGTDAACISQEYRQRIAAIEARLGR